MSILLLFVMIQSEEIWSPGPPTECHTDPFYERKDEQKVASVLWALVKHMCCRRWTINPVKYQGPVIPVVFRGLMVRGMPNFPFQSKRQIAVSSILCHKEYTVPWVLEATHSTPWNTVLIYTR